MHRGNLKKNRKKIKNRKVLTKRNDEQNSKYTQTNRYQERNISVNVEFKKKKSTYKSSYFYGWKLWFTVRINCNNALWNKNNIRLHKPKSIYILCEVFFFNSYNLRLWHILSIHNRSGRQKANFRRDHTWFNALLSPS